METESAQLQAGSEGPATNRETSVDARSVLELLGRMPGHLVCVTDADGEVVFVTPSIEPTLGHPSDRFAAEVRELLHPDDLEGVLAAWDRVLHDEHEVPLTFRLHHADGSWRTLDGLAINAIDVPGIDGIVFNARDVTARLEVEQRLVASEARLRAILEETYDVFIVVDSSMHLTWANARLTSTIGYELDDVQGSNVIDFVHPDDRDLAATNLGEALEGIPPTEPTLVRAQRKDGTYMWVEVIGANLLDDEQVQGIVLCLRDVHYRHEAELARRDAEERLRRNEQRFRGLVRNAADAVLVIGPDETVLYTSPQSTVFGVPADALVGRPALEHVHPDDLAETRAALRRVAAEPGATTVQTFRVLSGSGEWRWAEARVTNMVDDDAVGGVVANVADVTERVAAEEDARRLLRIFEATDDLVCVFDLNGRATHLNRAARSFLALDEVDAVTDVGISSFFASWELDRLDHELLPSVRGDGAWSGEVDILGADGRHLPAIVQLLAHRNAQGEIEYCSAVLRDISERKAFEDRLEHQATHDPLTGLPNRALLLDRLTMALARARRHRSAVAVLFLDLDHFKVLNDSHGHSLGDELLAAIANRLATTLRPDDTVARFGGDEFVVLCEDLHHEAQGEQVARRVQRVIGDPFSIAGTELFVGVSIGISTFDGTNERPDDDVTPEILLREADAAMYRAKERGRGEIARFDETLRSRNLHRLDTETALRHALERDELEVHYQPIIDLATSRVRHVEALVRWNHPERGTLSPAEFVPIAEETGLIVPLGHHVLETACATLAGWRSQHAALADVHISVNLSGRQLAHPSLVDDLGSILASTGLPGDAVVLEMTESLLMSDVEFSHQTLARLKRLDVRLAVDDFGTGYSSLSYLRSFPVDVLKVDRAFVEGLGTEGGDEAIVTAVVQLAHSLGLEAIAEGVETPAQLARLRALGCDMAQGFHLARPEPAEVALESMQRFGR